jgi:hypothetical protein
MDTQVRGRSSLRTVFPTRVVLRERVCTGQRRGYLTLRMNHEGVLPVASCTMYRTDGP